MSVVVEASTRLVRATHRLRRDPDDVPAEIQLLDAKDVLRRMFPSADDHDLCNMANIVVTLSSMGLRFILGHRPPTAVRKALPKASVSQLLWEGEPVDIEVAVRGLFSGQRLSAREILEGLENAGYVWESKTHQRLASFREKLSKFGFEKTKLGTTAYFSV